LNAKLFIHLNKFPKYISLFIMIYRVSSEVHTMLPVAIALLHLPYK